MSKETAVAQLKFLVAPGRRAGDFASPALNSSSETHKTAIYDARLIYGRGGFHGYFYAVQL